MRRVYFGIWIWIGLAACWTSAEPAPKPKETPPVTKPVPVREYRATIRIDAQPGGKKFQGVWLDFGGDKRWVLDYRPRGLWRDFADREVIVKGVCYRPFGQAISATHFRVDHLEVADRKRGVALLFGFGPERLVKGSFVDHASAPGTKLAGSSARYFHADGGEQFQIAGSNEPNRPGSGTALALTVRDVELDMSFEQMIGGPHTWIVATHPADYQPDHAHDPTDVDCP